LPKPDKIVGQIKFGLTEAYCSYVLQERYERHLFDKVGCSEASRFSVTKMWYAQGCSAVGTRSHTFLK